MFSITKHRRYNRKIIFVDEFSNTVRYQVPWLNTKTGKIDMLCFEDEKLDELSHHTEGKQKYIPPSAEIIHEFKDYSPLIPRMLKEKKICGLSSVD